MWVTLLSLLLERHVAPTYSEPSVLERTHGGVVNNDQHVALQRLLQHRGYTPLPKKVRSGRRYYYGQMHCVGMRVQLSRRGSPRCMGFQGMLALLHADINTSAVCIIYYIQRLSKVLAANDDAQRV